MGAFSRSVVDGELDLLSLCKDPSKWGEIHGEPRTVRRCVLSSLLSNGGYTLTRLQFRLRWTSSPGGCRCSSCLYGECLDREGRTFYFDVSPLRKWDVWDDDSIRCMYIGREDGFEYYCPEDALLRFEQKDGVLRCVYWVSLRAPIFPDGEYPTNRLQWEIQPHGYWAKYTMDELLEGAP